MDSRKVMKGIGVYIVAKGERGLNISNFFFLKNNICQELHDYVSWPKDNMVSFN